VRKAGRPVLDLVAGKPIWSGVRGAGLYEKVNTLLRAVFLERTHTLREDCILWHAEKSGGLFKGRLQRLLRKHDITLDISPSTGPLKKWHSVSIPQCGLDHRIR